MTPPMPDTPRSAARLDSWKAIADYLGRDVATVRRWEKTLGLPVRRVSAGSSHSVFAFSSEIDDWLKRGPAAPTDVPAPQARRRWIRVAVLVGAAIAAVWTVDAMWITPVKPSELRLEISNDGATAFDGSSRLLWRYAHPPGYRAEFPGADQSWKVIDGSHPAVYLSNSYFVRRRDGAIESGELIWLDIRGALQQTFSFDDEVTVEGKTLGPPWAVTAFAVDESTGRRRIAVAAHHYVWNPGLVTLLDDHWKRQGTFVHDGWIEDVRWMGPNRLLISGFSNAHDGGMLAILDTDGLAKDGVEKQSTPLRMVIMPRSELNRVTGSPFNRVILQLESGRVIAHTIEVPGQGGSGADAIYEFTPALDLVNASYSDHYWELHDVLEAQGKLNHGGATPSDRHSPLQIHVWDRTAGWKNVQAARTP